MKRALSLLFVLLLASSASALTLKDVAKLSKLNTSDDLILEMLQKDPLDHAITSKEVIYLKEQGVSERVIEYLLKIATSKPAKLPAQEGDSQWHGQNIRTFTTTNAKGKKVTVVTNLDKSGKRIGGEVPASAVEAYRPEPVRPPERPQEIHVVVERDVDDEIDRRRRERVEEEERDRHRADYYTYPLYNPIPLYPYPGYPYPVPVPCNHRPGCGHQNGNSQQPQWRYDAQDNLQRTPPSAPAPAQRPARSNSAGAK